MVGVANVVSTITGAKGYSKLWTAQVIGRQNEAPNETICVARIPNNPQPVMDKRVINQSTI